MVFNYGFFQSCFIQFFFALSLISYGFIVISFFGLVNALERMPRFVVDWQGPPRTSFLNDSNAWCCWSATDLFFMWPAGRFYVLAAVVAVPPANIPPLEESFIKAISCTRLNISPVVWCNSFYTSSFCTCISRLYSSKLILFLKKSSSFDIFSPPISETLFRLLGLPFWLLYYLAMVLEFCLFNPEICDFCFSCDFSDLLALSMWLEVL